MKMLACRLAPVILLATLILGSPSSVRGADDVNSPAIQGRIVAINIPGASTITPVGNFLPGGPIHDKPALAAFTEPGQVLDPVRILVGSNSNFGAPLARTDQREGSILSIDPHGDTVRVPSGFAFGGGQASALAGRVQVFTANSPAFLNSIKNPAAATADFTGASNPLGLSINLAFGRLWPVNAPTGLSGNGSSTILDPQGWGLAGAPNPKIGGVYSGDLTNRGAIPPSISQVIPGGLNTGAVGTAFLGASPDGSGKAVFAVVAADGSIVQEHTLQGLDGLAPPGTISPLLGKDRDNDEDEASAVTPRLGVILAWEPKLILFVSEPFENRIAVLDLTHDDLVFRVDSLRHFTSAALHHPVDLAPVAMEITDPGFSSNTTLDSDSDFYVANSGNNTIVRMTQTGTVISVRRVVRADGMPLGGARLNGIATSPDGSRIWVTVIGHLPGVPHSTGAVLELPSF